MRYVSTLLLLPLLLGGCDRRPQGMEPLLRGGKADLLVVFKPGTQQSEVDEYLKAKIVQGDLDKSFWPRPGIDGIVQFRQGDRSGYSVVLDPRLSQPKRVALRQRLSESPVVEVVLENVDPKNVKLSAAGRPNR